MKPSSFVPIESACARRRKPAAQMSSISREIADGATAEWRPESEPRHRIAHGHVVFLERFPPLC